MAGRSTGRHRPGCSRDLAARATIIVLFSMMAFRFGADFLETGRVTGLFLLLERDARGRADAGAPVGRRGRSQRPSARPDARVDAGSAAARAAAAAAALAPELTTVAISCAGLAIVIAGKITLGRSFALLPANRGVVSTGVYRVVRHPIYMGYLITHVAFLVGEPVAVEHRGARRRGRRAARARRLRGADARAGSRSTATTRPRVRWRVAPGCSDDVNS